MGKKEIQFHTKRHNFNDKNTALNYRNFFSWKLCRICKMKTIAFTVEKRHD